MLVEAYGAADLRQRSDYSIRTVKLTPKTTNVSGRMKVNEDAELEIFIKKYSYQHQQEFALILRETRQFNVIYNCSE